MIELVYVTADIHGDHTIRKFATKHFKEGANLTKDDYVIIAGDFGLIWHQDNSIEDKSDKYWRDWLDTKPWTTLFVDGNHENFDRLNNYPVEEWHGGKIHKVGESIYHLMRGQVFNINDKKIFCLGGGKSHDIEYRTPYKTWWPQEVPSNAERNEAIENLTKHNWKVDYVITHDAPRPIASHLVRLAGIYSGRHTDEFEEWLDNEIAKKLEFKKWYFGHHHMDIDYSIDCPGIPGIKYHALYHDIVPVE